MLSGWDRLLLDGRECLLCLGGYGEGWWQCRVNEKAWMDEGVRADRNNPFPPCGDKQMNEINSSFLCVCVCYYCFLCVCMCVLSFISKSTVKCMSGACAHHWKQSWVDERFYLLMSTYQNLTKMSYFKHHDKLYSFNGNKTIIHIHIWYIFHILQI